MCHPRGSAPKGGDDVMAVMIRFSAMAQTCPGPGNRNLIETTRDLSEIASDNLTYQLLYYITTSTCATVSSHILSYAAIYKYMALHRHGRASLHSDILVPVVLLFSSCPKALSSID